MLGDSPALVGTGLDPTAINHNLRYGSYLNQCVCTCAVIYQTSPVKSRPSPNAQATPGTRLLAVGHPSRGGHPLRKMCEVFETNQPYSGAKGPDLGTTGPVPEGGFRG